MVCPRISGRNAEQQLDPMEKGVIDGRAVESQARDELEHDRGVDHCQESAGHLAKQGSVASHVADTLTRTETD